MKSVAGTFYMVVVVVILSAPFTAQAVCTDPLSYFCRLMPGERLSASHLMSHRNQDLLRFRISAANSSTSWSPRNSLREEE